MKSKNYLVIAFIIVISSALTMAFVFSNYDYRDGKPKDLIGGEKDGHGCLIAAGYSWCEAKQECLRAWEESCLAEADEEEITSIRQAFMDKYQKQSDEIQITVNQFDGNFARGGVKFSMDGGFGPGGLFLSYKENGVWKIAFDGNGMYSCNALRQYDFPDEMIPDCTDGELGALDSAQLANPASVYCEEQGGESAIKMDADGGQFGVCVFSDGTECDEWAFYRGECGL